MRPRGESGGGAPTLTVDPMSIAAACAVLEPSTLAVAVGGDSGVLKGEKGGIRDSGWGLWCIDGWGLWCIVGWGLWCIDERERREKGL